MYKLINLSLQLFVTRFPSQTTIIE